MSNCDYIKDDGEQCGIECGDDEYCHIHSDEADAVTSSFAADEMPTMCSDCETAVKATGIRLEEAGPNDAVVSKKLVVSCLCSAAKLSFTDATEYKAALPDGWT